MRKLSKNVVEVPLTANLLFGTAGGIARIEEDYPYHYREELPDGSIRFTFSKNPMITPSLIERAEVEFRLKNLEEMNKWFRSTLEEALLKGVGETHV